MNAHKLIISLIIDNSASMQGTNQAQLQSSLNQFLATMRHDDVEVSVIVFNDFNPQVLVDFNSNVTEVTLPENKFPLLGKTLAFTLQAIQHRMAQLESENVLFHRPWIILLSNGMSYDDSQSVFQHYNRIENSQKPVIFPFLLSSEVLDENTKDFEQHKQFITIRDVQYEKMFAWLKGLIETRIKTDISQSMRLNKSDMLEWIKQ